MPVESSSLSTSGTTTAIKIHFDDCVRVSASTRYSATRVSTMLLGYSYCSIMLAAYHDLQQSIVMLLQRRCSMQTERHRTCKPSQHIVSLACHGHLLWGAAGQVQSVLAGGGGAEQEGLEGVQMRSTCASMPPLLRFSWLGQTASSLTADPVHLQKPVARHIAVDTGHSEYTGWQDDLTGMQHQ